jgi:hypothetical protein
MTSATSSALPEVRLIDLAAVMLAALLEADASYGWPAAVQADIILRLRQVAGVEPRLLAVLDDLTDDAPQRSARWQVLAGP